MGRKSWDNLKAEIKNRLPNGSERLCCRNIPATESRCPSPELPLLNPSGKIKKTI